MFTRISFMVRLRTPSSITWFSSNEKAAAMWSFSQSLMLFQNCVAWLKWSLKLGLRSRTLVPGASLSVADRKAAAAPGWGIGQPPPRLLGKYDTLPLLMVIRAKPSRWLLSGGFRERLIGISWKFGPTRRSWVSM